MQTRFEILNGGAHRKINLDSPEIRFMQELVKGNAEGALAFLEEEKQFGGKSVVDAPQGRYVGLAEIGGFVKGWPADFRAEKAEIRPVVQTRSGGRSVTEFVFIYQEKGEEKVVPMAAVAEVRGDDAGKMDELHIYFQNRLIPGFNCYRPPVFPSTGDFSLRHEMLTGSIREYFLALHDRDVDFADKVDALFAEETVFGGYDENDLTDALVPMSREELKEHFSAINVTLSNYVKLRLETIIDDGCICCVEWEQIVTKAGREERNRLSEAGISFYERDELGRIKSVRIIDYAYQENNIDWTTARLDRETAEKLNYMG